MTTFLKRNIKYIYNRAQTAKDAKAGLYCFMHRRGYAPVTCIRLECFGKLDSLANPYWDGPAYRASTRAIYVGKRRCRSTHLIKKLRESYSKREL